MDATYRMSPLAADRSAYTQIMQKSGEETYLLLEWYHGRACYSKICYQYHMLMVAPDGRCSTYRMRFGPLKPMPPDVFPRPAAAWLLRTVLPPRVGRGRESRRELLWGKARLAGDEKSGMVLLFLMCS